MGSRIIIAGGGTGGHIFPAIAIANAIKKIQPDAEILFIGAKGKMEMEKVPQAGYRIEGLDIAGFNRSSLKKNVGLPFKLAKSFFQVRKLINAFEPDAVIGVGGYSSFPVLRFAQAKGIKTFIHESNSFAGKSNMLLGKKATRIFVATDGMDRFFPGEKIVVAGNPIRPSIANLASIDRRDALRFFQLDESKKTLLVVGGSLGARSVNEAVGYGLDELLESDLQIIWQTGNNEADKWKSQSHGRVGIWVDGFITHMEKAYAAADIVVSRAGAMAIAELCVVKKPVLFVPYPFAAEDHQTMNAVNLVGKNAALMINDKDVKTQLIPAIIALAANEQRQSELRENIGRYGTVNADEFIAREILSNIR